MHKSSKRQRIVGTCSLYLLRWNVLRYFSLLVRTQLGVLTYIYRVQQYTRRNEI